MSPDEILKRAAETFAERTPLYGNSWQQTGRLLWMLCGTLTLESAEDYQKFFLVCQIANKLARFCNADFDHQDSAHDMIVYAAMLESTVAKKGKSNG